MCREFLKRIQSDYFINCYLCFQKHICLKGKTHKLAKSLGKAVLCNCVVFSLWEIHFISSTNAYSTIDSEPINICVWGGQ